MNHFWSFWTNPFFYLLFTFHSRSHLFLSHYIRMIISHYGRHRWVSAFLSPFSLPVILALTVGSPSVDCRGWRHITSFLHNRFVLYLVFYVSIFFFRAYMRARLFMYSGLYALCIVVYTHKKSGKPFSGLPLFVSKPLNSGELNYSSNSSSHSCSFSCNSFLSGR